MDWLTDLLEEYPQLSAAKEQLSDVARRLKSAEGEVKKLRDEVTRLRSALAEAGGNKKLKFVEHTGVLWKRIGDAVEAVAYCPTCQLPLEVFPPGSNQLLICIRCKFTASFKPYEINSVVKAVNEQMSS